jgi:TRAP-type C4-dicarboxylate transport system permease small subunit
MILEKITRLVEHILVVMFGIMAVLVFGNVVLRYGFNSGIVFSEEVSRYLFMWQTLIGALLVMKDHGHLGMTSLVDHLGETGQRICRFLADGLALVCCAMLAVGAWKQIIISLHDQAPVTHVSMGLVKSGLLISSIGIAIFLAHSLWRQLTGRMTREELVPHGGKTGE